MSNGPDSEGVSSGFRVYRDAEHMYASLAGELAQLIRTAVSSQGACHMVFPGGRSPRRALELLSEQQLPWAALHLYPSDERCLPMGDAERNDRLVDELLLGRTSLPPQNLHRIPAELGPEEGAAQYSRLLRQVPCFDAALLGVGPDGHTASLFPRHPALSDERPAVPVRDAPKPPPARVSIGFARLLAARERWVIVTGSEKRDLMIRVRQGADLPVMRVRPTAWFMDVAAAPSDMNFVYRSST